MSTQHINDRLGPGGLNEVVTIETVKDQIVLDWAGGLTHLLTAYAGMVVCKPSAYIEIPTATQVIMEFDDVVHDPMGVYSAADNTFYLPEDIVMLDWDVAVELANTASTYGNVTGNRRIILPAVDGMGTINAPLVTQSGSGAGGGIIRALGLGVEWDHATFGSSFTVKFSQDSGSTIRIGDSPGTGVAQTYFKMRMYRAFA